MSTASKIINADKLVAFVQFQASKRECRSNKNEYVIQGGVQLTNSYTQSAVEMF